MYNSLGLKDPQYSPAFQTQQKMEQVRENAEPFIDSVLGPFQPDREGERENAEPFIDSVLGPFQPEREGERERE